MDPAGRRVVVAPTGEWLEPGCMLRRRRALVLCGLALAGCLDAETDGDGDAGGGGGADGGEPAEGPDAGTREPGGTDDGGGEETPTDDGRRSDDGLAVTSPAFEDGDPIPTRYTGEGDDTSPPLVIDGVPEDAASLALVMEDPDAPEPPFTHWLCWAIPPDTATIPRALGQSERLDALDGAIQGENDFGELGYRGPLPPEGDGPHRYRVSVYAVESPLDLDPGADRAAVDEALGDGVLATGQLAGTYEREDETS